MFIKMTSKNQITLPEEVLNQIPDVEYFEVKVEKGKIVLIPAKISIESIRNKIAKKNLTERVVEEAIKWARENG